MVDGAKRRKAGRPATAAQGGSVQSLTRALGLLEHISRAEIGLSLAELAELSGLAPSTAHRLLNTLLANGFVEFDDDQNLWSVGLKSFSVGNAYLKKRNFAVQARPFMKTLMQESGETANLAVLDGTHVVFIAQVECLETMRMVVRLGSRGPLHATGVGKAMLSRLPPAEVKERLAQAGMPRLTAKTITNEPAFLKEMETVCQQGYAIDDEEQKTGLTCFAANIYDEYSDVIAALSISGPSVRLTTDRHHEISRLVMKTADQVTHAIGGRKP